MPRLRPSNRVRRSGTVGLRRDLGSRRCRVGARRRGSTRTAPPARGPVRRAAPRSCGSRRSPTTARGELLVVDRVESRRRSRRRRRGRGRRRRARSRSRSRPSGPRSARPGSPSESLVRMNTSIAAEDLRDVVAVPEHVHVLAEPARRDVALEAVRAAARRRRPRGGPARRARASRPSASSARSGRFCSIRWPTNPTSPTSSAIPSSRAQVAAPRPRGRRATNGSGSRKFGIAQIGPSKPRRAELVAEVGGERDGGVDAAHDRAPAAVRGPGATSAAGIRGCVATRSAGARGGARAPRPRPRGRRARSRCRPARARGDGATPAPRAASARTPPSARRVSGGRSTSSLPSKPSPSASTRLE